MTGNTPPDSLAPHHLRLFALIIDYLVVVTALKLFDQLALGEHWDLRQNAVPDSTFPLHWLASAGVLVLAKDVIGGRSIGKWFTGIAVTLAAQPGLAAPLHRNLLRNLTLFVLPVDAIFMFRDRFSRRLGDRLAGTVVVVPAKLPTPMRRLIGMAILAFTLMLSSFIITPWNMKRSAAYQEAERAALGHPAVIAIVGEPVEVNATPAFSLEPEQGSATITFEVEGPRGSGRAEVFLRMVEPRRRWALESVSAKGDNLPEIEQSKAPRR